jgi:para-nitrobenzyl esterase
MHMDSVVSYLHQFFKSRYRPTPICRQGASRYQVTVMRSRATTKQLLRRSVVLALLLACSGSRTTGASGSSSSGGIASSGSSIGASSSSSTGGSSGTGTSGTDGSTSGAPTVVTTALGPVQGVFSEGVLSFEGIPYAAPPVGDLRWRPPQPASPWTQPLDAASFGQECVQLNYDGTPSDAGVEDCLTLNVWTPTTTPSELMPVMVYIHGGYFVGGSASVLWHGELLYDGSYLAATGPAVVVTLQYRLGALGFLSEPALANPGDPSANYGLLDQIAALEWVRSNAAAFGGDASRLTIFGQSAGGLSVCALLASPLAVGLFSGAIIQSGGCLVLPATTATAQAEAYEQELGCADAGDLAACMRAVPAAEAAATLPGVGAPPLDWQPTVDGTVLLDQPFNVISGNDYHAVPVIIGNTSNEMSSQIAYYPLPYDPASGELEYEADLQQLFPNTWPQVEAEYPLSSFSSGATEAVITVLTDSLYVCPGRQIARALAAQAAPTWRYIFEHGFEQADFPATDPDPLTPYGAYHLIDVPYVFHDVNPVGFTWAADELTLSVQTANYFLGFAATGNPAGASSPYPWPQYEYSANELDGGPNQEWHLDLNPPPAGGAYQYYLNPECDFWAQQAN